MLFRSSHPTDAFERPTNEWTYDKVKVGSYADEADLTYTKEVKLGDIYKDLGLSDTIAAGNVTFHVDGAAEATPESTYALSKGCLLYTSCSLFFGIGTSLLFNFKSQYGCSGKRAQKNTRRACPVRVVLPRVGAGRFQ